MTKVQVDHRRRMPSEREAITHKFSVGGFDLYLIVGLYADGSPGEIFIHGLKTGSTIHGFTDTFSILFSMALQHGVPLAAICGKLVHQHFEPSDPPELPGGAPSIPAYVCRYMEKRFLKPKKIKKKKKRAA